MELFPIGTLNSSNSTGTYGSFAEPNKNCSHNVVHTSLVAQMESNVLVTRKKAERSHIFTYSYENIWAREFLQIEKFFNAMYGRVTSFYLADLSRMQRSSLSLGGGNYTVTFGGSLTSFETSYYTTTEGEGGQYVFVWDAAGFKFRLGKIATINTSVSVVFPDATDYVDLAAGTTPIVACPVYRVCFGQDQLNAEPGEFNPSDDADGGFMYSLDISFTQYGVK